MGETGQFSAFPGITVPFQHDVVIVIETTTDGIPDGDRVGILDLVGADTHQSIGQDPC